MEQGNVTMVRVIFYFGSKVTDVPRGPVGASRLTPKCTAKV